jgi:hypothetical protein
LSKVLWAVVLWIACSLIALYLTTGGARITSARTGQLRPFLNSWMLFVPPTV